MFYTDKYIHTVHIYIRAVTPLLVGASAVQWNRLNSQLLASVHDSDVRIWDTRVSAKYCSNIVC